MEDEGARDEMMVEDEEGEKKKNQTSGLLDCFRQGQKCPKVKGSN